MRLMICQLYVPAALTPGNLLWSIFGQTRKLKLGYLKTRALHIVTDATVFFAYPRLVL